jgi:hypothetical protein
MEHVQLDATPNYEALSYVWGLQVPAFKIECEGSFIDIGQNLYDCLKQLRSRKSVRTLWIDKLSINQDNPDEKAHQVELMAEIYKAASQVVIWLGLHDSGTAAAWRLIDKILTQLKTSGKGSASQSIKYPPAQDPGWDSVRALLTRPWFFRVWTFQEIVLAKEALLVCGPYELSWGQFDLFLGTTRSHFRRLTVEQMRLSGVEDGWLDIYTAREALHQPSAIVPVVDPDEPSVLQLLACLRHRQATDPRDKVYALLSLAKDAKKWGFKPDYKKSPADVYATTMKWILRTHKKLAFLSLVEKKDKPDLISWVPDLRYKDHYNFMHQNLKFFGGGIEKVYNASGSTNAIIPAESEPLHQLTVHGIQVGIVTERTNLPGNFPGLNGDVLGRQVLDDSDWQSFARSCCDPKGLYLPTGESADLAFQRLRMWDMLPGEGSRRRRRTLPLTSIPKLDPQSLQNQAGMLRGDPMSICASVLKGTTRKRMIKTDTRYMGLAHRSVEVGDRIFVLMGAECPFVLRAVGGKFFGFGGECYIHGIMDGEMLHKAREKRERAAGIRVHHTSLMWIDNLKDNPWPFDVEEITLV